MAGRVGGHGWPGRQAWLGGAQLAGWASMAGQVCGMAGLVELGGQAGSGRDRQGGAVGAGLVNVPMYGSLRCVCLRS